MVTPIKILEQWNFSIIRGFILLKPEILAHVITVSFSLFFLHPQALDSLALLGWNLAGLAKIGQFHQHGEKKVFKGLE